MKKRVIAILSLLLILLLVSCGGEGENTIQDTFRMTATVENVGERIEVNVTQAEYATGVYWVITTDTTEFLNENSGQIVRSNIQVGDTVEILYNGQVMMSYPPQIVALRVTKQK